MYNSSVQLGPTSFAKIKRTKFQVSRLRQSRSMYTGIVTGALNLVLWPYYQMTPNKLFIWPFTICTKHLQKLDWESFPMLPQKHNCRGDCAGNFDALLSHQGVRTYLTRTIGETPS